MDSLDSNQPKSFPVSVSVLFGIMVLSLIFNIFLFARGRQSYSVKYELMLTRKTFRINQGLCGLIEVFYKSFFVLPFLLLAAIAIIRAFQDLSEVLTIIVNGLILILIVYPFKTGFFYVKEVVMWGLAITSQFVSLYLDSTGSQESYYALLCSIFYPANSILFCLALLAQEDKYWEVGQAVRLCEPQLAQIYPAFVEKQGIEVEVEERERSAEDRFQSTIVNRKKTVEQYTNIPFIFNGGIFGLLCRHRSSTKFRIIYLVSLALLGVNAGLIYASAGSSLGIIGMITNIIYDIFIFTFNTLDTPQRSMRNVFILVFVGRFFSFAFGEKLWIFGYCVLYFFVGIFIGRIIINKRLPLRVQKQSQIREWVNALKTPEFVIFILTAEIFVLVLAASQGLGGADLDVDYGEQVSVPLWQFALVSVFATWIVIMYMASFRMWEREMSSVHEKVQYYFGCKPLKEFHIYIAVTYACIIGLGLYCQYFLRQPTALYACIFLPLIYITIDKLMSSWKNNQYQLLADIPDYNAKAQKIIKVIERKERALRKHNKADSQEVMNSLKQIRGGETNKVMVGNSRMEERQPSSVHVQQTFSMLREGSKLQTAHGEALFPSAEKSIMPASDSDIVMRSEQGSEMSIATAADGGAAEDQLQILHNQKKQWKILPDWREPDTYRTTRQVWGCLTPSDRWIIILLPILCLLFVGLVVTSYVATSSVFGVFVVITLLSLLSTLPFYQHLNTFQDFTVMNYVWYEVGFAIGVLFWVFNHDQLAYTMLWSAIYVAALSAYLIFGVAKQIKKSLLFWLILNILMTLVFVCVFLGLTGPPLAAAVVSILIFMACVGNMPIAYSHIEGHIPTAVKVVCGVLIVFSVAAIAVIALMLDLAGDYLVYSFIMGAIWLILMVVGCVIFYQKESDRYDVPHVYSAYGLPIYKFDSRAEQLKNSRNHKIIFDAAQGVLIIYAASVSLLFENKAYAIYILGLYLIITYFQGLLFAIKTYSELAQEKSRLTQELLGDALKELTEKYMIDFKQNTFSKTVKKTKDEKKKEVEEVTDEEELDRRWLEIAKLNAEQVQNREQEQKFLFYWLALIELHLFALKKAQMLLLIKQVKQIHPELNEFGIFMDSVNYALDFETKHQLLTKEIDSLHPFDYVNFQAVLNRHQAKSLLKSQHNNQKDQEVKNEKEKQEEKMFEELKEQMAKSSNDKIEQFRHLVRKQPKGKPYTDQFSGDGANLGSVLASVVHDWRRTKTGEQLIKDSIDAYDAKQGQIGDCYLISSLGVLGPKWIQPALGISNDPNSQWDNEKGAFMVRFFKFSREVYVIIDNQLPVDSQGDFVFARSEQNDEIWPCILEKAYAKLYSGYQNIIAGKVHRVLAELTGGFPFEILIESYKTNPNGLWQKILNSHKNGYLMGAGSPPHQDGDSAVSPQGIVQGHAYSVLEAKQVEGHKLIKLRNPHGKGGQEWTGDFSDESEFMTKRLMDLLRHVKEDDGAFWMNLDDFSQEFRSLYICAIFDPVCWRSFKVQGQFTEQNSLGTPNKSDETFRNPQYGITVTKKCTFFVSMSQQNETALEGKNSIYLRIQQNSGKRVRKSNLKSGEVCGSQLKPSKLVSVSNEATLQAQKYPYTFTLYISCKDRGDTGKYSLQMYCNDLGMELIEDKNFDRQLFQQ